MATARELNLRHPKLKLAVLEKENILGKLFKILTSEIDSINSFVIILQLLIKVVTTVVSSMLESTTNQAP